MNSDAIKLPTHKVSANTALDAGLRDSASLLRASCTLSKTSSNGLGAFVPAR